jgi:hypothetical protein
MKDANKIHFAAKVPKDLVGRIRLEAVRSGRRIQDIVAEALDLAVPRNRIIAAEPSPRRSTKDGGLKS